jgi:hypothetical protein
MQPAVHRHGKRLSSAGELILLLSSVEGAIMADQRPGFVWGKLLAAFAFILLLLAEMGFAVNKVRDAYQRSLNQTFSARSHHHS